MEGQLSFYIIKKYQSKMAKLEVLVAFATSTNYNAGDGGLYLFYGTATGIATATVGNPSIIGSPGSGEHLGDFLGLAVGDINGDGYADIAVGASVYNNGLANDGGVYLMYGSTSGITPRTLGVPTIAGKPSSGGDFGIAIILGDFNSDGYMDLAVGAQSISGNNGGVYLLNGSSSGIASTTVGNPDILGKPASGEYFGNALTTADLNADGYSDLVIGAFGYNNGSGLDGGLYIYNGSASGIASGTAGVPTIAGKASSAGLFSATLTVGDFNGDSYIDLIASAAYYNNGSANDGGIYVFYGTSSGIVPVVLGVPTIAGKPSAAAYLGVGNPSVADINGDGWDDLVTGASRYNNGSANDGGVYIFSGSNGGLFTGNAGVPTIAGKPSSGSRFGETNILTDLNADGYPDLAIGAPMYNNGAAGDGGVYIYSGSNSGISGGTAGIPTLGGKPSSSAQFGVNLPMQ